MHILGAALVFGVGVLYELIQTMLTYHMYPEYNGLYICRVRLTICIVSMACMVLSILYQWYLFWQLDLCVNVCVCK